MVKKFGVSLSDSTGQRVEERRVRDDPETGDREIVPRSVVVEELLELGLVVESVLEESELELDSGRSRRAFARQAILNEVRRELDE